ncbi:MAG: hypothetical protein ACRD2C_00030 [Acidimicrobiales bacterium]
MQIRLIQRDHPDQAVNNFGVSHRDPYFEACWGALLDPRTTNLVARVADLTRDGGRIVSLDELSHNLDPTPADRRTRLNTINWAMQDAEASGLGWRRQIGANLRWFCVYRNVPLLDEPSLQRLTDPELFAHGDAIRDINLRLAVAGIRQIESPGWLSERPRRANPTVGLVGPVSPEQSPAAAKAQGRLEALRQPQAPATPGLSL